MNNLEMKFMERIPDLLQDMATATESIAKTISERLPEMKLYVWVLTYEQAWNGSHEDTDVYVFATEEKACSFMQYVLHEGGKESVASYIEEKGWEVEVDEPDHYMACVDGCYDTDHVELTITKCEIKQ